MCEICGQYPCHPRCPNYIGEPKVHKCTCCGEDICEGDKYYELPGGEYGEYVCEDCLEGMTAKDFLWYLDEDLETAELENPFED